MKDQTLKFRSFVIPSYPSERTYQLGDNPNLRVCANHLQDYFDIPKSAKNVFIRLTKKPVKDSYKVETISWSGGIRVINSKGVEELQLMYPDTKDLINQIVGELEYFYVSVKYS